MAELLKNKIDQFEFAVASLQELFTEPKNRIVRDAMIQRFEYTVEAFWKLLKTYLLETEGVEVVSPKSVIREARAIKLLSDEEVTLALQMIDDRTLSTHLYSETMAEAVYNNIKPYFALMQLVRTRLKIN